MKYSESNKVIFILSNIGYIIGCLSLYIMAIWIIGSSVKSVFDDVMGPSFSVYNILDEVGLIVFAIAVIDVSKYLLIEEVIRFKHEKDPEEIKRTLSKFVIIIATALSLKGLVLTFETAKTDITKIHYPVTLIFTAILFIVGLGIYQKLHADAERPRKK